jgi:hypothetical protein
LLIPSKNLWKFRCWTIPSICILTLSKIAHLEYIVHSIYHSHQWQSECAQWIGSLALHHDGKGINATARRLVNVLYALIASANKAQCRLHHHHSYSLLSLPISSQIFDQYFLPIFPQAQIFDQYLTFSFQLGEILLVERNLQLYWNHSLHS